MAHENKPNILKYNLKIIPIFNFCLFYCGDQETDVVNNAVVCLVRRVSE
jgi:hypothetical protein